LDGPYFDYTCTRSAGIELIFPAIAACPSPADDALSQRGDRMRCVTEIAHVAREAVRVFCRRLALAADGSNLTFQLPEQVRRRFIFYRAFSDPIPFQRHQFVPPWPANCQVFLTEIFSDLLLVLHHGQDLFPPSHGMPGDESG